MALVVTLTMIVLILCAALAATASEQRGSDRAGSLAERGPAHGDAGAAAARSLGLPVGWTAGLHDAR